MKNGWIVLLLCFLVLPLLASCLDHGAGASGQTSDGDTETEMRVIEIPEPEDALLRQIESDLHKHYDAISPGVNADWEIPFPILHYYGNYNGAVPVMHSGFTHQQTHCADTVANVTFHYGDSNRIFVWKDGKIYSMQEAYELAFLSVDKIEEIAYIHHTRQFIRYY